MGPSTSKPRSSHRIDMAPPHRWHREVWVGGSEKKPDDMVDSAIMKKIFAISAVAREVWVLVASRVERVEMALPQLLWWLQGRQAYTCKLQ